MAVDPDVDVDPVAVVVTGAVVDVDVDPVADVVAVVVSPAGASASSPDGQPRSSKEKARRRIAAVYQDVPSLSARSSSPTISSSSCFAVNSVTSSRVSASRTIT